MAKVKPKPVIDLDVGDYVWVRVRGDVKKTYIEDIREEKKLDMASGEERIKYRLTLCQK